MSEADPEQVIARVGEGIAGIDAAQWDACAGSDNPFLGHAFLSILEESGSVSPAAGWQSLPILIDGEEGRLAAAAPAYAKSHSQGEYVFDHAWADAFERAGGRYYPKLQIAVPFTPVPGPRLLPREERHARSLIAAIEAMKVRHGLSAPPATLIDAEPHSMFGAA